eukprot:3633081-Amphidinium_carterae.1
MLRANKPHNAHKTNININSVLCHTKRNNFSKTCPKVTGEDSGYTMPAEFMQLYCTPEEV